MALYVVIVGLRPATPAHEIEAADLEEIREMRPVNHRGEEGRLLELDVATGEELEDAGEKLCLELVVQAVEPHRERLAHLASLFRISLHLPGECLPLLLRHIPKPSEEAIGLAE